MRKASKKTPSGEKRSEHFTPPKCFKLSHHCTVSTDFFLLSSFLFRSFFLAVFKSFPKNYFSLLKSCQSANRLLFQKKKNPASFLFLLLPLTQVLLLPAVACHCLSKFVWILSPSASCSHTHALHSQRVLYLALTLVCSCVMKETHLLLLKCVCTYMCAVQSLL